MSSKTEIEPCPFCGRKGNIVKTSWLFYVTCPARNPKHTIEIGPYKRESDAIRQWNKRVKGT